MKKGKLLIKKPNVEKFAIIKKYTLQQSTHSIIRDVISHYICEKVDGKYHMTENIYDIRHKHIPDLNDITIINTNGIDVEPYIKEFPQLCCAFSQRNSPVYNIVYLRSRMFHNDDVTGFDDVESGDIIIGTDLKDARGEFYTFYFTTICVKVDSYNVNKFYSY